MSRWIPAAALSAFAVTALVIGVHASGNFHAEPGFRVVGVRVLTDKMGSEFGIMIQNDREDVSSLSGLLECDSVIGPKISEFIDLTGAKIIERRGYVGPAPGWTLPKGEKYEFIVGVPYLAKPESCRVSVVGFSDRLSETR